MMNSRTVLSGLATALIATGASLPGGGSATALPLPLPTGISPDFWLAATQDRVTLPDDLVIPVQSCGNDCGPKPPEYKLHKGAEPSPGPIGLSTGNTDDIVSLIGEANKTCGALVPKKRKHYRIDCLRWYYRRVADTIPDNSEYRPIRDALIHAADRLDAIVRKYRDPDAKKITPRIRNQPMAPKTDSLRAVSEASDARATREAAKVIEETKIVILRSGDDPTRRTAHYREIASAVDANLVILRSA